MPHLGRVAYWEVDQFRRWAEQALIVIRELRREFREPGDLVWRAQAAQSLKNNLLSAPGLFAWLHDRPAKEHLTSVP